MRVFDSFQDFYSEKTGNSVLKEYLKIVAIMSLGSVQDGNLLIELRIDLTAQCELSWVGMGYWTVFRFIIVSTKDILHFVRCTQPLKYKAFHMYNVALYTIEMLCLLRLRCVFYAPLPSVQARWRVEPSIPLPGDD